MPSGAVAARDELASALIRLVRGSMFKDFCDDLEAELAQARFILPRTCAPRVGGDAVTGMRDDGFRGKTRA